MSKREIDPDLLAKRIKKSNPSMSSESARKIAEDSARRVDQADREKREKR
jgi:hypothetical protein